MRQMGLCRCFTWPMAGNRCTALSNFRYRVPSYRIASQKGTESSALNVANAGTGDSHSSSGSGRKRRGTLRCDNPSLPHPIRKSRCEFDNVRYGGVTCLIDWNPNDQISAYLIPARVRLFIVRIFYTLMLAEPGQSDYRNITN